jgi:hypothetical protein
MLLSFANALSASTPMQTKLQSRSISDVDLQHCALRSLIVDVIHKEIFHYMFSS